MPSQWKFKHPEKTLETLLDKATVDAYGDDEQFMGVVVTLEDNLPFPFKAELVGTMVTVVGIVEGDSALTRGIKARVQREGKEYLVGLDELQPEASVNQNQYWEMYQFWLERF